MQVVLGSQEPADRWGKPSVLLSEKLCHSSWALATSVLQQAVGAALHDLSYNREYLPSLYGGKQINVGANNTCGKCGGGPDIER